MVNICTYAVLHMYTITYLIFFVSSSFLLPDGRSGESLRLCLLNLCPVPHWFPPTAIFPRVARWVFQSNIGVKGIRIRFLGGRRRRDRDRTAFAN